MDRLTTRSAGRCRLDLPPDRIADQHVANDLTALKLDVANL
jgi:hypothetical protein